MNKIKKQVTIGVFNKEESVSERDYIVYVLLYTHIQYIHSVDKTEL